MNAPASIQLKFGPFNICVDAKVVDEMCNMEKNALMKPYPVNPKMNSKFKPSNCCDNEKSREDRKIVCFKPGWG